MSFSAPAGAGRWLPAFALGFAVSAQASPSDDPISWLQRAVSAARTASYSGTFVHTNGDRISTMHVTHANVGGEERERIEPLDGPPHEIVRRNDEMFCYFPDAKTVRLDRRITARFFPSILPQHVESIAEHYDLRLAKSEQVLGYDCRWVRLEPKDGFRYAQRLCADVTSGLILRAKTLNDQHQVIEQYTFTDLKLGPNATRHDVKSILETHGKRWITDRQLRDESKSVDSGWTVNNPPPGFSKVAELRRTLPGRTRPISQLVFTDGLASLSVFIEPNGAPARTAEAATEDGTTSFYVLPKGDNVVTVLGEVPMATAEQVAHSVARRP